MQLGQLHLIEPQLLQMGYQLIAVSPDRPEKLREFTEKHQFGYLLVSDSTMQCASAFGIAFEMDAKMVQGYKSHGIDLVEAAGEKHHLLPVPAVFVVGTDGMIRFQYVNPNHKVRLDPDVLLAAARAAMKQ